MATVDSRQVEVHVLTMPRADFLPAEGRDGMHPRSSPIPSNRTTAAHGMLVLDPEVYHVSDFRAEVGSSSVRGVWVQNNYVSHPQV